MYSAMKATFIGGLLLTCAVGAAPQRVDLAQKLAAGKLRAVNRDVAKLQDRDGVHLSEAAGNGVVWIEDSDFAEEQSKSIFAVATCLRGASWALLSIGKTTTPTTGLPTALQLPNRRSGSPAARGAIHRGSGLRLAAASEGIAGGIRECGWPVDCPHRLGAAPSSRQGPPN